MARRVAGQVVRAHAHAAAQIPHRAVGVAGGVGARDPVVAGLDGAAQRRQRLRRVAIVVAQAVPRLRGGQVGVVGLHGGARHAVQPGGVVFVHVAQDDAVHLVEFRPDAVGHQRRVERDARISAVHDHLVAIRVLARLAADVNANGADGVDGGRGHGAHRASDRPVRGRQGDGGAGLRWRRQRQARRRDARSHLQMSAARLI